MKLDAKLAQLESAQLVRHLVEDEPAYIFKHALTHETVYQSILRQRRREIHASVAQTYEELYAAWLDDYAAVLAQHYAEAGVDTKTVEYSIRAGDLAMRMNANVEAIMHFTRAIEIAMKDHSVAEQAGGVSWGDLYLKRGRANELCGQYDAALTNYVEMESYARESGAHRIELAAMLARATLHTIPTPLQNLNRGKDLLDHALILARDLSDHAAEAKALWNLMLIEYFFGRQARSVEIGEQALRVAREFDLREQLAFILNDIGRSYIGVGRIDDASTALAQARELWQAQGNVPMLADNLATAEENAVWAGDYAQAKAFGHQALQISQSTGNLWNQAYCLMTLGVIHLDEGDYRAAMDALNETQRLGEQTGFVAAAWFARVYLAFLYGELGMPERGIALYEPLMDAMHAIDHAFKPWVVGILAYLNLLLGRDEQFKTLIKEAKNGMNQNDLINMGPIVITGVEGEWAMRQGEFEKVEQMCQKLLDIYRATDLHVFKSDALLLLASALRGQNKLDAAREILRQARDEAEHIGVRRTLWEILAEWSALEAQAGNASAAQTLRTQSRKILDFILAHTPDDLRESFLKLPTVKSVL